MGFGKAIQRAPAARHAFTPPVIVPAEVEWDRLVTLDFETYYDDVYTLKKLTTSEYIRDPRFQAQAVGIKIGTKPTRIYPRKDIARVLSAIPWATHSLLAHHAQFDGFILSHHYGIQPRFIYDTLSMARALHSQEIGAGLDEVSIFYGGHGKRHAARLDETKGVRNWSAALFKNTIPYVTDDVDECFRLFTLMHPKMPAEEIEIIDFTCRMFTNSVLKVDIPRVQKEHAREVEVRRQTFLKVAAHAEGEKLSAKELRELGENPSEEDIAIRKARKLIGSMRYADVLRSFGVEPPMKISPAWIDKPVEERDPEKKMAYAFAKTDEAFMKLLEHPDEEVRELVEARMNSKSNGNITRAGRFMKAGENGMPLPVYLKYAPALTFRWGGGNGMNMQNLKRGGELRKSILAPKGHVLVVVDSGQIEARKNAWLWGQEDLLDDFRLADAGKDRDAYCKFGDIIYGRTITKKDETDRFVAKTCVLGLGYQMGAERLRSTLALGGPGGNGPKIILPIEECQRIVYAYRRKYGRIKAGWNMCQEIIEQMARGISGSYKCIAWEKEKLILPNGMVMRYPGLHDKRTTAAVAKKLAGDEWIDPDIDMDWPQFVYERKGSESKLYGGLLCENIVQALARIVVANQLVRINRKHRIVMTTHDEGVFLAKKAQGQKVLDFAIGEFRKAPAWCPDLPLNAEGEFDVFYAK
jgi:hypothetical protein